MANVADLPAQMSRKIAGIVLSPEGRATPFAGLTLYCKKAPTACFLTSVEPSISIFLQGKKRINIRGSEFLCDESSFLVSGIDLPVQSQIIEASEEVPQVAMRLTLDMKSVREVLSREDLPEPSLSLNGAG